MNGAFSPAPLSTRTGFPPMLTTREAAEILRIKHQAFIRLIRAGRVKVVDLYPVVSQISDTEALTVAGIERRYRILRSDIANLYVDRDTVRADGI